MGHLDRAEETLAGSLNDDTTEVKLETSSLALRVVKQDVNQLKEERRKELLGTAVVLPELDENVGRLVVKVNEC